MTDLNTIAQHLTDAQSQVFDLGLNASSIGWDSTYKRCAAAYKAIDAALAVLNGDLHQAVACNESAHSEMKRLWDEERT